MTLDDVRQLIKGGESEIVEFKQSTGQLSRAGEALCAFLNGRGGTVLIGVAPEGRIVGQEVADKTQRDIAHCLQRFDPPASIRILQVPLDRSNLEVIVLQTPALEGRRPYSFDGRAYERVGSTTSVLPQEKYKQLLLDQVHLQHRWENQPADISLEDLDREEILRTARAGVDAGRIPEEVHRDPGEILDRLGLRREGRILQGAVVLFGTRFLPDYPQCYLRLARFIGVNKTEFMDHRSMHGHAFRLLDEGLLFLRRHLPVAGRVLPGVMERQDEPLFPMIALREALVNAFCHRDYMIYGGSVSLAIYDDRLEIWSAGGLPFGLTPAQLKRDHESLPRNP